MKKTIVFFAGVDEKTQQEWDILPRITFVAKHNIRAIGIGWLIYSCGITWEGKDLRETKDI